MKNTNKKIKTLIFIFISILLLTSAVFAVSKAVVVPSGSSSEVKVQSQESDQEAIATSVESIKDEIEEKAVDFENMKDEDIAKLLSLKYIKSQKEILKMKASLGSWQKVQSELEKFLDTLKLTQEQKIDLFNQGYKIQDIDRAEELALTYGITPDEILKMKSNSNDSENKMLTENKTAENSWEDARVLLDVKKSVQMSDLSPEVAKQIEAVINTHNQKSMSKEMTEDIEMKLLKANKVTDEEIAICKKNGITSDMDIVFAKSFSNKYNTSLQKVLDLKKVKGNWNDVMKELEVATNEK